MTRPAPGTVGEHQVLADLLLRIERHDTDYPTRYTLVLQALAAATSAGLPAGLAVDPAEPDFPIVVYLELPTGQVSWHMPTHHQPWDGHSTSEKYTRIHAFAGRRTSA